MERVAAVVMKPVYTPYDRVMYRNESVEIGRFHVSVNQSDFSDTGAIQNHILVVPSWSVEISYSRRESVVAEPTRAMCYNRGCEYRRRALNRHGDLSLWIAYRDERLAEALGTTPEEPFRNRWRPLPRDAFVSARLLAAEMARGNRPDALQVEDWAWWLLGRCLESRHTEPHGNRRRQQAVARARAYMAEFYREALTLSDIADAACMSPCHLSRVFHQWTGTRLHQYLMELRLRDAVREVVDTSRSLTEISADLGFASPSHFSSAFRNTFGRPPNDLRQRGHANPGRARRPGQPVV